MQWAEIRHFYPDQWLLLEAMAAHSEKGRRVLDRLAIVAAFADSHSALQEYTQLHHEMPERELYVFHTSREALEIRERRWLGIRAAT